MAIHSQHLTVTICTAYPTFPCLVPSFCFQTMSDSVTLHDDAFYSKRRLQNSKVFMTDLKKIFSFAACLDALH
jgi:hypothetical protein